MSVEYPQEIWFRILAYVTEMRDVLGAERVSRSFRNAVAHRCWPRVKEMQVVYDPARGSFVLNSVPVDTLERACQAIACISTRAECFLTFVQIRTPSATEMLADGWLVSTLSHAQLDHHVLSVRTLVQTVLLKAYPLVERLTLDAFFCTAANSPLLIQKFSSNLKSLYISSSNPKNHKEAEALCCAVGLCERLEVLRFVDCNDDFTDDSLLSTALASKSELRQIALCGLLSLSGRGVAEALAATQSHKLQSIDFGMDEILISDFVHACTGNPRLEQPLQTVTVLHSLDSCDETLLVNLFPNLTEIRNCTFPTLVLCVPLVVNFLQKHSDSTQTSSKELTLQFLDLKSLEEAETFSVEIHRLLPSAIVSCNRQPDASGFVNHFIVKTGKAAVTVIASSSC